MNLRPLRPDQHQKHPTRWSYQQGSEDFIGWVNSLGIEKTILGRFLLWVDRYLQLKRSLGILLFFMFLSFFISWDVDTRFAGYKEGDLAAGDIRSPLSFSVLDEDETHIRRKQSEENIPPVYDYDVGAYDRLILDFRQTMRRFRVEGGSLSEFKDQLPQAQLSKESFSWMSELRFKSALEATVVRTLEKWQGLRVLDDLPSGRNTKFIARILERGNRGDEFLVEVTSVTTTSELKKQIQENSYMGPFKTKSDQRQLKELIKGLISPNFSLNKHETEERRRLARESVEESRINLKKGQIIIRQGAPFTKSHLMILDELTQIQTSKKKDFISLMTAFFMTLIVLCYKMLAEKLQGRMKLKQSDFISFALILFLVVALAKFSLFLAQTVFLDRFRGLPEIFYVYLTPYAFGAMMIGLTLPRMRILWLYSVISSFALGVLMDRNLIFSVVCLTTSLMGGRWVQGCQKRSDFYWAGLKTGAMSSIMIAISQGMSPDTNYGFASFASVLVAGFLGGVFSSMLTLILVPLWESLFVYTTDVRLLELSNLNHPLLKDMVVKAPGSYHHSLVVGSMCEAAAEVIGANPLLAKVCSYYHDIGKTPHAQYFIENQRPGENRHDHISAAMSKTILVAHVKDGVELAHQYKLGQPIIDVIEQHHGNTLISFFYHKAKENEDTEMHEFSEEEFRYPGPRPQNREAALVMLADSIEAAARTLDEPTPSRLQNIVHTIIQKKFQDGQLDECELTLKDITMIEEAFARILMGIYHQRIDYPTRIIPNKKSTPNTQNS